MLLKVTEYCAWENEKWSYIIDLDKQDAATIHYLMIFIRVANEEFELQKQKAKERESKEKKKNLVQHSSPFGFLFGMGRQPLLFAASFYSFDFYDGYNEERNALIRGDGDLNMSNKSGYKDYTNVMIEQKISPARMKSAMLAMRDKKENKLYKSFEDLFLKTKTKKANAHTI